MKWILFPMFALFCMTMACGSSPPDVRQPTEDAVAPSLPMLRVAGNQVVDPSGNPVVLRGVAFGNQVWQEQAVPSLHHSEVDYERLVEMGMNSTRFYFNYLTFEDDARPGVYKDAGWQWFDQNIAWARKHGIYLILAMTHPPGGFQPTGGEALWEEASNQERLIELWRAIAARYRDEPVIAGYNLLNEPAVTRSREQWRDLSSRIIQAVREVDASHMLFIERVNCVAGDWADDSDRNFFQVDDPNVVYEFHFYRPFHFTHQNAPWVDFMEETSVYPDETRAGAVWFLTDWRTATHKSPKLPVGDSDWAYYEGVPFTVEDPELTLMKPTLVCRQSSGKAYFDDLVLERLRPDGSAEEMWRKNLNTRRGWWFWTEKEGEFAVASAGHGDDGSLSIFGTTGDAGFATDVFRAEQGETYRLSGWMKGAAIPEEATCRIRLDFLSARVPVHGWDKGFLEQELGAYLAWGEQHHVPVYLGEFGAVRQAFSDDRGGMRWVSDMLDLLIEKNVPFSYHDYHEEHMGMYFGDDTLPDPNNANTALIDLFKERLGPLR